MSEPERESALKLYAALGVLFLLLVAAGVLTVAMPELQNDPEQVPDAGTTQAR